MNLDNFLAFFNGIYCDYDGAYGDQCFDLANSYSRWIGGHRFTGGTADLIFNQPGDFYIQIPNTPDGVPQKGDIVIWSWPHVGIATGNNSNTASFEVLEQNDPTDSNCHIKQYPNYNGVIGWLRPKQLPVIVDQAEFNRIAKLLHDNEQTNIQKDGIISDLNIKVNTLASQLDEATKALQACQAQPPITANIQQFHDTVYAKWSVLPGTNNWVNRLHQLKKIFEIGHL